MARRRRDNSPTQRSARGRAAAAPTASAVVAWPAADGALASVSVMVRGAMEAAWLAAAGIIPLIMMHQPWMTGYIQVPKVATLRTVAVLLVVLLVVEWAMRPAKSAPGTEGSTAAAVQGPDGSERGKLDWLGDRPARWILATAGAVLVANLISFAFAPVKNISFWGIDPGWDTYGLFNILSFLVVFGVIATHLRTHAQLRRLLWVILAVSVLVSLYGVFEHFGWDPLQPQKTDHTRAALTFGNPIFGAAFLVMTIPLALALVLPWRDRLQPVTHVALGVLAITAQLTAVLFTLSRGPWIGLIVALVALLVLTGWAIDQRRWIVAITMGFAAMGAMVLQLFVEQQAVNQGGALGVVIAMVALVLLGLFGAAGLALSRFAMARMWLMLLFATVVAFQINLLPSEGVRGGAASSVATRVATIAPAAVAGGLTNRLTIWRTATKAVFQTPWVDTERFPALPELSAKPLRPIVGYGQDMFPYAYPLVGESTYTFELASHGHNFIVHTALELGLLGVAAYLSLIAALGWALVRILGNVRGPVAALGVPGTEPLQPTKIWRMLVLQVATAGFYESYWYFTRRTGFAALSPGGRMGLFTLTLRPLVYVLSLMVVFALSIWSDANWWIVVLTFVGFANVLAILASALAAFQVRKILLDHAKAMGRDDVQVFIPDTLLLSFFYLQYEINRFLQPQETPTERAKANSAGRYPPWLAFVAVGLAASLAGRVIEQIPGKAQVSDLALFWVLAGAVVAFTFVAASTGAPTPQGRRDRRPAESAAGPRPAKLLLAGVVAVFLSVVWWQTVWTNVQASNVAQDGEIALEAGRFAEAETKFQLAIDWNPNAPLPHLQLASAFDNHSRAVDVDIQTRATLIARASDEVMEALAWNPLDQRAWSRAGELSRELAVLVPALKEDALVIGKTLPELMPGFWQSYVALGWSLVRLGEPERALEVLDEALTKADRPSDGFLARYMQGVAYRDMGRLEDAVAAAEESLRLRQDNPLAVSLLLQLQADAAAQSP